MVVPSACLFLARGVIFEARRQELADHLLAISFYVLGHPETFAVLFFIRREAQPYERSRGAFRLRRHAHGHGLV